MVALSWTTEYGQHLRSHHRRACHNTKANNDNTRVDNQYARADDCIRADGLSPAPGCEPVEKIIYDLRVVARGPWSQGLGKTPVTATACNRTRGTSWWTDTRTSISTRLEVGKRLEPGGYQTWVCLLDDHPCGDPHYCWVYHETDKVFMPWGTNTELGLVPGPK